MKKWMIILVAGLLAGCTQSETVTKEREVTSSPVVTVDTS